MVGQLSGFPVTFARTTQFFCFINNNIKCRTELAFPPCAEYVNTANLTRILRARKVDRDQLAQLKSLEKRLRAQGGDHHRLDFALPDPQVCVDDLFGRLYPKRERGGSTPSLQGLKRDVRKALAHDQYTDVDMVNAHPAILSQLFLKLGLACPALERYVAEREAVLAETGLGRDEAKQAFITLMYGGERKDPTPFMAEFREEFLTNATAVSPQRPTHGTGPSRRRKPATCSVWDLLSRAKTWRGNSCAAPSKPFRARATRWGRSFTTGL